MRKPLTWLILAELLLASRISGVSGITWMEALSAFQASVYKCYGGSKVKPFMKAHTLQLFSNLTHFTVKKPFKGYLEVKEAKGYWGE